jgi:hypothetical protein
MLKTKSIIKKSFLLVVFGRFTVARLTKPPIDINLSQKQTEIVGKVPLMDEYRPEG